MSKHRTMTNRWIAALLAAAVLTAACSSAPDEGTERSSAATQPEATTAPATTEPTATTAAVPTIIVDEPCSSILATRTALLLFAHARRCAAVDLRLLLDGTHGHRRYQEFMT